MAIQEGEATRFLAQLFTLTQGDLSVQQSMYDVGSTLGLDKAQSGKVAETLIGQGLVEIKTLSGGVSITAEGVASVQSSGGQPLGTAALSLGSGIVIETGGRTVLDRILAEIKAHIAQIPIPYAQTEEMVMDIKTIETQLLSPQPKVAVIREILRSLQKSLSMVGLDDLSAKVEVVSGA
jgi:hypothetical protein